MTDLPEIWAFYWAILPYTIAFDMVCYVGGAWLGVRIYRKKREKQHDDA